VPPWKIREIRAKALRNVRVECATFFGLASFVYAE